MHGSWIDGGANHHVGLMRLPDAVLLSTNLPRRVNVGGRGTALFPSLMTARRSSSSRRSLDVDSQTGTHDPAAQPTHSPALATLPVTTRPRQRLLTRPSANNQALSTDCALLRTTPVVLLPRPGITMSRPRARGGGTSPWTASICRRNGSAIQASFLGRRV
ncbi:hypothetical protein BST61_g6189 [Cercospora zeina]